MKNSLTVPYSQFHQHRAFLEKACDGNLAHMERYSAVVMIGDQAMIDAVADHIGHVAIDAEKGGGFVVKPGKCEGCEP